MKRRPLGLLGAWVLLSAALVPLIGQAQMQAPGVAARVNGEAIALERLERSFEEYLRERQVHVGAMRSPQRAKVLKREALDLLIEQELLWQEARRRGLVASPEQTAAAVAEVRGRFPSAPLFDARLATEGFSPVAYDEHVRKLLSARLLLEQLQSQAVVDEGEIADFYRRHADRFEQAEQRRLSHIAIRVDTDDARREAHARVEALRVLLRAGADFVALARQHSEGPQAAQGGDLGFVRREDLAEPLSSAAFALDPHELSATVDTADGVHLLRVDAVRPARRPSLDELRERIATHLRSEQAQRARRSLVERLTREARIEVLVPLPARDGAAEDPFSPAQRARAVTR